MKIVIYIVILRDFMKRLLILLSFVIASLNSNAEVLTARDSAIIWQTKKFRTILLTAVKNYKDTVDIKKISEAAFSAMLESLDPYSNYLREDVYQHFKSNYFKTVRTTGIEIISIKDTLFVLYVRPDSPAEKAGIVPGDKIIYLAGKSAIGMNVKEANKELTVKDSIAKPINIVIKRYATPGLNEQFLMPEEMPIISVTSYFILPGTDIGYIKSKRFSKTADSVFRLALKLLMKQGAKSIIFDIRGHQGGQVKAAADIVDEFIPEGKTITYIEGKNNKYFQKYISEPGNIGEDIPLVVLIDNHTMSAAEIFAGAIQDLDRGVLVGDISYGKGMAQKSWSFKDGSAFRLTIGDYYSPIGRNIQKPHKTKKMELDPALKLSMGNKSFKNIEKEIAKFNGQAKIPTFTTPKGRLVLGGGGIFPDYFALPDTTTLLTRVLKKKSILIEAAFQYLDIYRDEILNKYGDNYRKFIKEFSVSDEMLKQMEIVSRMRNIWNEKMFLTDKEYIRNFYKSLLVYFLWGDDAFFMNESANDKVLKAGIKHITDAVKLFEN